MWARGVGKLRGAAPPMAPLEIFSMGWTKSPCLHLLRVSPSPRHPRTFKNQALKRISVSPPASGGSPLCDSPRSRASPVRTVGAQQGARRVNSKAGRREGSGQPRGAAGWELIHSHPFNRWPAICSGSQPQPRVQPS